VSIEGDRKVILDLFEKGAQNDAEKRRLYDRFHARLRRYTAGTILRDAARNLREGDIARCKQVAQTPGLSFNSTSMRGPLGESPVHVAAAGGAASVEALDVLLQLGFDPNSSDALSERPLHYATLTGNVVAMQQLLAARADPFCESMFGETPLTVAEANPAGFLGISTSEAVATLEAAEAGFPAGPGLAAVRGFGRISNDARP